MVKSGPGNAGIEQNKDKKLSKRKNGIGCNFMLILLVVVDIKIGILFIKWFLVWTNLASREPTKLVKSIHVIGRT